MIEKSKKGIRNDEAKRAPTQLSLPISEKEEVDMTVTEIVVTEITTSSSTSSEAIVDTTGDTTEVVDTGKDFEETLIELEKVVNQLEGEVKLEEALQLFERGMKLSKSCDGILKSAEQKIEILKRAADGNLSTEKFSEDSISAS